MNPDVQVSIRVASDGDARRISAVLAALGYEVTRDMSEVSPASRIAWAAGEIAARFRLTTRERDILDRVLQGRLNTEIDEELGISKATVKWHMHNVYVKTGTDSLHTLLLLGLRTLAGEPT